MAICAVDRTAVAVFGGTFDPVHRGHLQLARTALAALPLAQLRLMPAGQPPHKGVPGASAEHRLAMLELALGHLADARVLLDDRELQRPGPSWMVDTLAGLRAELGPATPLVLLLGADAWAQLGSWHQAARLPALAHVAVFARPASDAPAVPPLPVQVAHGFATGNAAHLASEPCGRVVAVAGAPMAASASALRRHLAARHQTGKTPDNSDVYDDLLIPELWAYIEREGLYAGPSLQS